MVKGKGMRLAFVLAFLTLVPNAAGAADPKAGEAVFRKCQICHAVGEGAQTRLGPVLNGLIGRKAGTYEGYSYSDANKNSNIVWDEATLAKYLKNPKAMIPGTNMLFAGLPKDQEIEDVIAYLKQFGPDGRVH
jgi:cytochrome c